MALPVQHWIVQRRRRRERRREIAAFLAMTFMCACFYLVGALL